MFDLIIGLGESLIKHGVSLSFIGAALFVVLKQRPSKRWIRKHFPRLMRDDADVMNYEARQIRIENKLDAMARHMGVELCADTLNPITTYSMNKNGRFFTSFWAGLLAVRSVRKKDRLSYTNLITRRKQTMSKWFKADSLTVIIGVLTAAITRYLNIDIDPANIIAGTILLLGYFKANEFVTIVRDANGLPTNFRLNSRKFIFTFVAFLIVVVDEVFAQISIPMEFILAIAGTVTGYNYAEAKKDAKQAEKELPPVTEVESAYHSA